MPCHRSLSPDRQAPLIRGVLHRLPYSSSEQSTSVQQSPSVYCNPKFRQICDQPAPAPVLARNETNDAGAILIPATPRSPVSPLDTYIQHVPDWAGMPFLMSQRWRSAVMRQVSAVVGCLEWGAAWRAFRVQSGRAPVSPDRVAVRAAAGLRSFGASSPAPPPPGRMKISKFIRVSLEPPGYET